MTATPLPIVDLTRIDPTDWRTVLHEELDDNPGGRVLVLTDHDPEAILQGCRGERSESITWEVTSRGPGTWRTEVLVPPGRPRLAISTFLRLDHARVQEIVEQLGDAVSTDDRTRASLLLAQLQSDLRRHMRREEEILFPAFVEHTGIAHGPTDRMKEEHDGIRGLLKTLESDMAHGRDMAPALASLLANLGPHEEREEQVLYPMTDHALPARRRAEILQAMKDI